MVVFVNLLLDEGKIIVECRPLLSCEFKSLKLVVNKYCLALAFKNEPFSFLFTLLYNDKLVGGGKLFSGNNGILLLDSIVMVPLFEFCALLDEFSL